MKIQCAYDKLIKIKDLTPHPKNRNKHNDEQIDRLAKILQYQGWRRPVRVSKLSGLITAGHGAVLSAQKNKWKEVPVNFQNYENEAQEYADVQADNAIASWAELDLSEINLDIGDLGPDFDIDLLGIKDFEIEPADKYGDQDADAVPDVRNTTDIRMGDLFQLGHHRLLCGDSTEGDSVRLLMNGEKADITFTSPPYNAAKNSNLKDKNKYQNFDDQLEILHFADFLYEFTVLARQISSYQFINIQSLSGNKLAIIDYLGRLKAGFADFMVWDKGPGQPAMAKNVLNSSFEFVLVFSEDANRVIGTKKFRGTLENVIRMSSKKDKEFSDIHKATMPVSFASYFVDNFSSNSVYEPFSGSGSTLIACEKTNRKCFGMEIDPQYCQVIIDRWEKFTGQKAIKAANSV